MKKARKRAGNKRCYYLSQYSDEATLEPIENPQMWQAYG